MANRTGFRLNSPSSAQATGSPSRGGSPRPSSPSGRKRRVGLRQAGAWVGHSGGVKPVLDLKLTDDRHHVATETLDLLVEVQERGQDQIDPQLAVLDDPLSDLLRRADQLGAETV